MNRGNPETDEGEGVKSGENTMGPNKKATSQRKQQSPRPWRGGGRPKKKEAGREAKRSRDLVEKTEVRSMKKQTKGTRGLSVKGSGRKKGPLSTVERKEGVGGKGRRKDGSLEGGGEPPTKKPWRKRREKRKVGGVPGVLPTYPRGGSSALGER